VLTPADQKDLLPPPIEKRRQKKKKQARLGGFTSLDEFEGTSDLRNPPRNQKQRTCYACGNVGHFAKKCPEPDVVKIVTHVKDQYQSELSSFPPSSYQYWSANADLIAPAQLRN